MGKNIDDMVAAKFLSERLDVRVRTIARELIGFVVPGKPVICAQPTVCQPNCIAPPIMPAITNFQAGTPQGIGSERDCNENKDCNGDSASGADNGWDAAHLFVIPSDMQ